jgi:GNAT superfamily N-acetyltransferase
MLRSQLGQPPEIYFDARYAVLRQPLGMPRGSERLTDDQQAAHAWVELDGQVIAVGRAHVLPNDSDGSGLDHKGPGAAAIPAFGPLIRNEVERPVFQIRQMGTLPQHQRQGHAAAVLGELERFMVREFATQTGFLQARELAVPFYLAQGWTVIDEPYSITNIGPHRSMMKTFGT